MSVAPDGSDPIADGLAAAIGDGVITGWVLIATYIDEEGNHSTYNDAAEGQRNTLTLGLLDWGLAIERAAAVTEFSADE